MHHEKLAYILAGWGLGRLLFTGGHCSEVVVIMGLTVLIFITLFYSSYSKVAYSDHFVKD